MLEHLSGRASMKRIKKKEERRRGKKEREEKKVHKVQLVPREVSICSLLRASVKWELTDSV